MTLGQAHSIWETKALTQTKMQKNRYTAKDLIDIVNEVILQDAEKMEELIKERKKPTPWKTVKKFLSRTPSKQSERLKQCDGFDESMDMWMTKPIMKEPFIAS